MFKFKNLIIIMIIFWTKIVQSQNNCGNPTQMCFDINPTISFPASTTASTQPGPYYGCITTAVNPTWFYFKTNAAATNTIQLYLSSTANVDIDGMIWGPFSTNTNFCSDISVPSSTIACSFSTSNTETLTIPNALPNMYYVVLATNYSGLATNININCTVGASYINCPTGPPIADFSFSNTSVCQGKSIFFTDMSSPAGSISSWQYVSSTASPTTSTLQNPTFTFNTLGTHTVSLLVTNTSSLTSTITKTIQVNPNPTITVTPPNLSICSGNTATLSLSGALNYTTNPGGITSPSFTLSPSTTTFLSIKGVNSFGCFSVIPDTLKVNPNPVISSTVNPNTVCLGSSVTFSNSGASSYTLNPSSLTGNAINVIPSLLGANVFTVSGTNLFGCIGTKTVNVTTLSLPNVFISPSNTTICNGTSQTLTANGPGNLNYFWSSGSTTPSITVSPTTTTSYTVTASDSFGCQNTFTTTVNVTNTPSVSISSPSTNVCTGYTMAISASGASNYTWSTGATTSTTVVQPFFNTMYNVIGSNGGSCTDTVFLSITTLPLPSVSATASQTMACVGQTVNLIGIGNATQYLWNPGLLIGQNQTVQILAPITYSLVGQGANGCANYSTVFINANNNNSANVIPVVTPSVVCLGDSAMLSVIGGNVPSWGAAANSIYVTPTAPTNYTVNVVDLNGCNSNIVFHVGFDPDCGVTVYNGFTPNGDGINDYFFIENIYKYPNNNVHIFNRWGNKLISFSRYNNATNKWDGKVNGNVVASGTYYFLITNDNDKVLKKGWIEITN